MKHALSLGMAAFLTFLASAAQIPETLDMRKLADEMLAQISKHRELPIKQEIRKSVVTRAQIKDRIQKMQELHNEPRRMELERKVLIELGLIPEDFDYVKFTRRTPEHATSWYDPEAKTLYLVDTLDQEIAGPALIILAVNLTYRIRTLGPTSPACEFRAMTMPPWRG